MNSKGRRSLTAEVSRGISKRRIVKFAKERDELSALVVSEQALQSMAQGRSVPILKVTVPTKYVWYKYCMSELIAL